jgi:hypothetical protein
MWEVRIERNWKGRRRRRKVVAASETEEEWKRLHSGAWTNWIHHHFHVTQTALHERTNERDSFYISISMATLIWSSKCKLLVKQTNKLTFFFYSFTAAVRIALFGFLQFFFLLFMCLEISDVNGYSCTRIV